MTDSLKSQPLHDYLETFHCKYLEKLKVYVPEKYRNNLLRMQHLESAKVVGYVSTIHGVGYEYRPGSPGNIKVTFGSARVEEFIFRFPRGFMDGKVTTAVRLQDSQVQMTSCVFNKTIPVRLEGLKSSATLVDAKLQFRGQATQLGFAEIFVNRSAVYWSKEKAVERAMDEVLQASVYVAGMERLSVSLDDYLERFKKGRVLVLGDFSDAGKARVETIKIVLTNLGYYAFTLSDVKEVPEYDLRQKLTAVAPVCRFIVVDDSSRAGQAAEIPILELLRVIAIVARLRGSDSTFVNRPLDATSRVIREVEYEP